MERYVNQFRIFGRPKHLTLLGRYHDNPDLALTTKTAKGILHTREEEASRILRELYEAGILTRETFIGKKYKYKISDPGLAICDALQWIVNEIKIINGEICQKSNI